MRKHWIQSSVMYMESNVIIQGCDTAKEAWDIQQNAFEGS